VLAWHRRLIARKYTTTPTRPGRQPTSAPIRTLIIRMATDNPMWGHRRVQGEWARLGHQIAASTVWGILHDAGIDPAPGRSGPSWHQFLTTQAHGILAIDFFHIDTILLERVYALILIGHGSRRIHLLGISANPDGAVKPCCTSGGHSMIGLAPWGAVDLPDDKLALHLLADIGDTGAAIAGPCPIRYQADA
jgi:hypothetical protein